MYKPWLHLYVTLCDSAVLRRDAGQRLLTINITGLLTVELGQHIVEVHTLRC